MAQVRHKRCNSVLQGDSYARMARVQVCLYWLSVPLHYSMVGLVGKVGQMSAVVPVLVFVIDYSPMVVLQRL